MQRLNPLLTLLLLPALGSCSLLFAEQGAESDATISCGAPPSLGDPELIVLACGETQIDLASVDPLYSDSECPVARLRWSLNKQLDDGSGETELFSYEGAPGNALPQEARILGGTFVEPIFNLTSYHGPTLGQFDIKQKLSGVDQLFQDFPALSNEPYRFRVAVATSAGQSVRARLFPTGSNGNPALGIENLCLGEDNAAGNCTVPAALTTFIAEEFETGGLPPSARLRFQMGDIGTYWFDLASLGPAATQVNQLANPSFSIPSTVGSSPWGFDCANSSCGYDEVPIPVPLQEYGTYLLRLTAIAADGMESDTKEMTFVHEGC